MNVWRTKSVEQSIAETDEAEHQLKKTLGTLDLIVFGVGVIIGAGIFVLTGTVAASNSGPAIALSFAIAGVACALAALCYAEFASTVPVAGSAYTFSYATFGELIAWIIGWDLVLEFTIGSAALSTSFSGYLQTSSPGRRWRSRRRSPRPRTALINLPAVLVALLVMTVLILGIKFSSRLNQVVVAIKLAVVAASSSSPASQYVKADNYSPFIPPAEPTPEAAGGFLDIPLISSLFGLEPSIYGVAGVVAGAAIVFFAFIGFDIVATTAEETKNPQRDVPRGILGSLAIVTVLYMAVSLVVTGMQDYRDDRPRGRRAALDRLRRQRRRLDGRRDRRRRLHRPDRRGDDPDARPDPGRLRDGARRAAAPRPGARCTRGSGRRTSSRRSPVSPSPPSRGSSRSRRSPSWSTSAPCSRSCWSASAS